MFDAHKIFLNVTDACDEELFNPDILFNEGTFCIRTSLENNELIIQQVSRYFEKNTMYSSEEIKGTLLGDLMPADIR